MAELFTLTLGRDIEIWPEMQQLQPESSNSNVTSEYLEKERKQERPSSSNDTDTLLLDNTTTPATREGSIVKLESVKC